MVAPFVKRPTSPLHFEPISVPPEDVLCLGSDDDDTVERHRKRRRIEELGQKYLEGKPLFIQSASLRGPLHNGWVNPWARKKVETTSGFRRILHEPQSKVVLSSPGEPKHVQAADRTNYSHSNLSKSVRRSDVSDLGPPISPFRTSDIVEVRRAQSTEISGHAVRRPRAPAVVTDHASESDNCNLGHPIPQRHALPAGTVPSQSTNWLKSDKAYWKAHTKDNVKPSTPTPTPRSRSPQRPSSRTPRLKINSSVNPAASLQETRSPVTTHYSSFTPVNKRVAHVHPTTVLAADEPVRRESEPVVVAKPRPDVLVGPEQLAYRETAFAKADGPTKEGYINAKKLSQHAIQKARDEEGYLQARRLSEGAALQASQEALKSGPTSPQRLAPAENPEKSATVVQPRKIHPQEVKATPHEVPPSTNLAEFQYRLANKRPTSSSEKATSNNSSFAQQMQAAKAKAEAQSIKRLSFTASGRIKSFGSRSTSRASSISPTGFSRVHKQTSISNQERCRREESSRGGPASSKAVFPAETSECQPQGPEAQQVSIPPAQLGALPSGPSTHLFETANEADEGDSYLNLSTQAAISKAQRSFQSNIVSPLQNSPRRPDGVGLSQPSPTAYRTPTANLPPIPLSLTRPDVPDLKRRTPLEDALSTQAIMDAISPFAVTTVKKPTSPSRPLKLPKGTSFAPSPLASPSHNFGTTRRSLSMSTSSDSSSPILKQLSSKSTSAAKPPPVLSKASTAMSKPPSTTTSTAFSIAPNGTLTELYQQDGQQQYDVGTVMGMDGWDLDEAIEEAGSFLATGAWDVEAEARKEGNFVTSGSRNHKV